MDDGRREKRRQSLKELTLRTIDDLLQESDHLVSSFGVEDTDHHKTAMDALRELKEAVESDDVETIKRIRDSSFHYSNIAKEYLRNANR